MQLEVEKITLLLEAQILSNLHTVTPCEFEQKLLVHTVQGLKLRMQLIREYRPFPETQGQRVGRKRFSWAKVYKKNRRAPVLFYHSS